MAIIRWTNKFSGEVGYVKQLRQKDKCFENTYEKSEAKTYSDSVAKGVVTKLISYGEGKNNDFEVI